MTMNKKTDWFVRKKRNALLFMVSGLIVTFSGILFEVFHVSLGFDARLITGSGFLVFGVSFSNWLQYLSAIKDPKTAKREYLAQMDEREIFIRSTAGNRAFWISIVCTYSLLMWESLSSNGSVPQLSDNTLWYWLAAAVVIPFITYIVGIIQGESIH